MALFNKLPYPDSKQTQLAYMLNYYPAHLMPANTVVSHIAWSRKLHIPKDTLLSMCNEELTTMRIRTSELDFKLQWAFNNVPTELEWQRKGGGYLITVELRISPITGPVALLSFGTVKHINPAHAN